MNHKNAIIEQLKKALILSCSETYAFSDDETKLIDAEYLVTVNAAKAIFKINKNFPPDYKIYLEKSTAKFASDCPPLLGKHLAGSQFGHRPLNTKKQNTKRNGKIDIAVYKVVNNAFVDVPVCAIEVKGFRPPKQDVLKDLRRNAEYFLKSSNTGDSQIEFSSFIALHYYRKTLTKDKELSNIERLKEKYEGWVKEITLSKCVQHSIDVFTIRKGELPDPEDPYYQDQGLDGTEDYHFLGVIVCFYA